MLSFCNLSPFGTGRLAYFQQHTQDMCIIIRVSINQCHLHMCHRSLAWTYDVTLCMCHRAEGVNLEGHVFLYCHCVALIEYVPFA